MNNGDEKMRETDKNAEQVGTEKVANVDDSAPQRKMGRVLQRDSDSADCEKTK